MADLEDHMVPVEYSFDLRRNRDWVELDGEVAKAVRELVKRRSPRALSLPQNSATALTKTDPHD
jgi:hypothetical protein